MRCSCVVVFTCVEAEKLPGKASQEARAAKGELGRRPRRALREELVGVGRSGRNRWRDREHAEGRVKSMDPGSQWTRADQKLPASEAGTGALAQPETAAGARGGVEGGLQQSAVTRDGNVKSAFKGIAFAAVSAAGSSGARREHLRSFLTVRRKHLVHQWIRLLETLLDKALAVRPPTWL